MSFTCPLCGMTSHNPNDAENRYCGNCHKFISPMRPLCTGCGRRPDEIREYSLPAQEADMPADVWVRQNEGTYNPANGHFLCSRCYIAAGAPSTDKGWVAP